jgi:hypothetical protein
VQFGKKEQIGRETLAPSLREMASFDTALDSTGAAAASCDGARKPSLAAGSETVLSRGPRRLADLLSGGKTEKDREKETERKR